MWLRREYWRGYRLVELPAGQLGGVKNTLVLIPEGVKREEVRCWRSQLQPGANSVGSWPWTGMCSTHNGVFCPRWLQAAESPNSLVLRLGSDSELTALRRAIVRSQATMQVGAGSMPHLISPIRSHRFTPRYSLIP